VAKEQTPEKKTTKNVESVKANPSPKVEKVTPSKKETTPVPVKQEIKKAEPVENSKKSDSKKSKKPEPVVVRMAPPPPPGGFRKIIVDYKNVPDEVLKALSDKYPHGYNKGIIKFTNAKKELVSAVPIELGEYSYLVKVSTQLQKMVNDYDEDELFPDVTAPISEKEIPVGAGGDFDDFDKSDEDDSPKRKAKGRVKSADDLEYGFSDDDEEEDDDDDDDDDEVADGDDGDDDDE
jgi:hypothetical protein